MRKPSPEWIASSCGRQAHNINRHHQGCIALSRFFAHGTLFKFLNGSSILPSNLEGRKLSSSIVKFCQSNELSNHLIITVLEDISCDEKSESQHIAQRILRQIRADFRLGVAFRKPLHYIGTTEIGLVIAIVIYDRFWTEDWDLRSAGLVTSIKRHRRECLESGLLRGD